MLLAKQLRDIQIIAKHVENMAQELDEARRHDSESWGDGFWAEPKIQVVSDADEPLGTIGVDDSLVYFSEHKSEN